MFDEDFFTPEAKQSSGFKLSFFKLKQLGWRLILFIFLILMGFVAIGGGLYFLLTTTNTECVLTTPPQSESSSLGVAADISSASSGTISTSSATALATNLTSPNLSSKNSALQAPIYVDLAGAVVNPGLYQLESGSRLAMAIEQGGGFSPQADHDFVTKELNLARKLQDGEKIYIYSQAQREYQQTVGKYCAKWQAQSNEAASMSSTASSSSFSPAAAAAEVSGDTTSPVTSVTTALLSINTAAATELETLVGIGEKRAADIIAGRPYTSIEELVSKEVLTQGIFDKIKAQLIL